MCFDTSTTSISGLDPASGLPPLAAPPQFADSPPDEVSFGGKWSL